MAELQAVDTSGPRMQPGDTLLALAAAARAATTAAQRRFVLLDRTRDSLPYHAAVLRRGGTLAHSGVAVLDAQGPFGQWLARLFAHLAELPAGPLAAESLGPGLAGELAQWWPPHLLWLPGEDAGDGWLLVRELPWRAHEAALLREWFALWQIVDAAARAQAPRRIVDLPALAAALGLRGKRRRSVALGAAALLAVLCFPVTLSVRAPGEIVPRAPTVLRAATDGMARRLHVEPNQAVREGQLLAELDDASASSRLQVARQGLATAEAELRQTSQAALGDAQAKAQLAVALGRVEEKRTEVAFLGEQMRRTELRAPHDGVVLVDDPGTWAGRTVAAGEALLRLARPDDQELEAWLPAGDAVELADGAPMRLFLASRPATPAAAQLRSYGFEAQARPDGTLAYRLRGTLAEPGRERLGARGTVHADAGRVPLVYWVLRRPLAGLREATGW
jgi:multidrug efflux pump subunit AcrA (membrane-fusion protein)